MSKKITRTFTVLGLVLCLAALWLAFANLNADPVMLKTPEEALNSVETMMDALCAGDYGTVESRLYGTPKLGLDREPESQPAALIHSLYRKSLSYQIAHAPSVTGSGLAVCVTVDALDTSRLAQMLTQKVMALPPEEGALPESWSAALAEIAEYPKMHTTITLNLVRDQDQWWILPEEPLMQVASGTME